MPLRPHEDTVGTKRTDGVLVLATVLLCVLGLMLVYSTTLDTSVANLEDPLRLFRNQTRAFIIGLIAAATLARIRLRWLQAAAPHILVLTLAALVFLLIRGEDIFGSSRFLVEGSYQPGSVAKLALILYLAAWLASRPRQPILTMYQGMLPYAAITVSGAGLVALLPDISAALLLVVTALALYLIAGADLRHLTALLLATLAGLFILISSFSYAATRIVQWLDAFSGPAAGNYHVFTALLTIQNGGLLGTGFRMGQVKYFLPLPHSDSVFAVVFEEFGLVGGVLTAVTLALVAVQGLAIARRTCNYFGFLLAAGISVLLLAQAILHVGSLSAVIPFTGVTLPFISHGGSELVVFMSAVGLLLNVSRSSRQKQPDGDTVAMSAGTSIDIDFRKPRPAWVNPATAMAGLALAVYVGACLPGVGTQVPPLLDTTHLWNPALITGTSTAVVRFITLGLALGLFVVAIDARAEATRFNLPWSQMVKAALNTSGHIHAQTLGRFGPDFLATYADKHSDLDLTLDAGSTLTFWRFDFREEVETLWWFLTTAVVRGDVEAVAVADRVIALLAEMLETQIEFDRSSSSDLFNVYRLNAYNFKFDEAFPRAIPVLFPTRQMLDKDRVRWLNQATQNYGAKGVIVILVAWSDAHLREDEQASTASTRVAILDKAVMHRLAERRDRQAAFRTWLQEAIVPEPPVSDRL